MKISLVTIGIFVAGFLAGGLIVFFVPLEGEVPHIHSHSIFTMSTERGGNYLFTSPLLDCEINEEGMLQVGIVPFGSKIEAVVDSLVSQGRANSIAVYYRDLSNGPWFGVQEEKAYLPASLLKVPVMIAYLKASEKDPAILSTQITFEKEAVAPDGGIQMIPPSKTLELGKQYTALELIEYSIIYSDNQAVQLLYENIDGEHIFDVYRRIGIDTMSIERPGAVLSPRDYAAFFRVLHNASYLSRENSERALEILSRVEQKAGIVAGVPSNTLVAHKFGEAGSREELLQFHDCGIIYHPKRHYLLCVMSQGEEREPLIEAIAQISKAVWDEIDSQTREEEKSK